MVKKRPYSELINESSSESSGEVHEIPKTVSDFFSKQKRAMTAFMSYEASPFFVARFYIEQAEKKKKKI